MNVLHVFRPPAPKVLAIQIGQSTQIRVSGTGNPYREHTVATKSDVEEDTTNGLSTQAENFHTNEKARPQ